MRSNKTFAVNVDSTIISKRVPTGVYTIVETSVCLLSKALRIPALDTPTVTAPAGCAGEGPGRRGIAEARRSVRVGAPAANRLRAPAGGHPPAVQPRARPRLQPQHLTTSCRDTAGLLKKRRRREGENDDKLPRGCTSRQLKDQLEQEVSR